MIIYVDIDETICGYSTDRDYNLSVPWHSNIDKINKLYNEGNTIVYWTARGTVTGIDWYSITKTQLDSWGVLYHELQMGKPNYDLFIDDKAINTTNFFK